MVGTCSYIDPNLAPTYLSTTQNSALGPQDPKYLFPASNTFPYRRGYSRHISCKDTTLSTVRPQPRLVLGGWHINTAEYSNCKTDTGLAKNNHGSHKRV